MPYNDPFGNPLNDWQNDPRNRTGPLSPEEVAASQQQFWNPQQPQAAQSENRPGGLENYGENAGPYGMTWGIPQENLGAAPTIPNQFSPEFNQQFEGNTRAVAGNAANAFNYQLPTAQAAQMGLGGVPQPGAQQFGTSSELQSMLSGEGWDPKTMAQMRSRAIDDVSGAGRTEMGQASRAMERAGLSGSPAGAAVSGDVARRSGIQQNSALRDIDIGSAMQGIQNKQFGIGQQTGIGMGNMQQANSMALANANRLFSGMSQNLGNQQQANMGQFGAESERLGNQAGAGAGVWSNAGSQYNNAALNQFQNANQQNAQNQMTQGMNQAGLNRGAANTMFGAGENRNQQAISNLWNPGQVPMPGQQQYQGYNPFGG